MRRPAPNLHRSPRATGRPTRRPARRPTPTRFPATGRRRRSHSSSALREPSCHDWKAAGSRRTPLLVSWPSCEPSVLLPRGAGCSWQGRPRWSPTPCSTGGSTDALIVDALDPAFVEPAAERAAHAALGDASRRVLADLRAADGSSPAVAALSATKDYPQGRWVLEIRDDGSCQLLEDPHGQGRCPQPGASGGRRPGGEARDGARGVSVPGATVGVAVDGFVPHPQRPEGGCSGR